MAYMITLTEPDGTEREVWYHSVLGAAKNCAKKHSYEAIATVRHITWNHRDIKRFRQVAQYQKGKRIA